MNIGEYNERKENISIIRFYLFLRSLYLVVTKNSLIHNSSWSPFKPNNFKQAAIAINIFSIHKTFFVPLWGLKSQSSSDRLQTINKRHHSNHWRHQCVYKNICNWLWPHLLEDLYIMFNIHFCLWPNLVRLPLGGPVFWVSVVFVLTVLMFLLCFSWASSQQCTCSVPCIPQNT